MNDFVTNYTSKVESTIKDILMGATASNSKSISRSSSEAGITSLINAKTGKRKVLSKGLMKKLNYPKKVQISFTENSIIIGEELPNNYSYFNIKPSDGKGIIYSSQLVQEITERFELDFSDRTSITFNEVEYAMNEDYLVAIIKV